YQRQRGGIRVVITPRPHHHLAGFLGADLPSQGRGPEPRQARRVGGVNDKVHQTGRHTANLPSAATPPQPAVGWMRAASLTVPPSPSAPPPAAAPLEVRPEIPAPGR